MVENQKKVQSKDLDRDLLLEMYRKMLTIRRFEEMAYQMYLQGLMAGVMHFAIGQEAVSVGATIGLRKDDYITSTHRGHGDVIAKGAQPDRMLAELRAKQTGYCKAKGGSLHIMDFSQGVLGANGIVAAGVPIATGAGLSIRMRGTDQVVVCFIGDGVIGNGAFHEGFHMAALWKLPVIVIRHNNQYAESTPLRDYQGMPNVVEWVKGYGVSSVEIDGNDILKVYDATSNAVAGARNGEGPFFIDCLTYRWMGHNVGDPMAYRPDGELEKWKEKDPIAQFESRLLKDEAVTKEDLNSINSEVETIINDAVDFAEKSPKPDIEQAITDVYA
ncbi:thiamine pyrophosphate-dependent dehydrogenase E1 component subunit alpha [Chloroflexota bacterium]